MNTSESRGVVYVAFGEKYRAECSVSMSSLREIHPELPVCVITDSEWSHDPKPEFVLLRQSIPGLKAKPTYISETPFDETLYLDTDTVIVNPILEVFELLRYFDIAINFRSQFLRSETYFLPWCNSGVLLFRKNEAVIAAFDRWLQMYVAAERGGASGHILDDRYLPVAVAESEARVIHLPPSLNFFLNEPQTTCSPVRIIHSRNNSDIAAARRGLEGWDAQVDWNSRVWIPQLRNFFPVGGLRSWHTWKNDPLISLSVLLRRLLRNNRK